MKIVHIAPSAVYNEGWGYQDNLLPKYQAKLGHDVTYIVNTYIHQENTTSELEPCDYVSENDVRVIRLKRKKYKSRILTNLRAKLDVYAHLVDLRPDFIFYHGITSTTIYDVIKYKKKVNPSCIIVCDNHLDYNIGNSRTGIKKILIRSFYRHIVRKSIPYIEKVYGVTPWRKEYAEDYYRVPSVKTDVLIMGADDEKINFENRDKIRNEIRKRYGVSNNDFLIVTGGKIDEKKKIHILMEACGNMDNVKLLVFGNVAEELKDEYDRLINAYSNIISIGWISADSVYDYFFASDLVFFPGQHSVLWEQACAAKAPCVFAKWPGMDHVNNGGNSDFVDTITVESLKRKISELHFTEKYYKMKDIAISDATNIYLYSEIAKKSLNLMK